MTNDATNDNDNESLPTTSSNARFDRKLLNRLVSPNGVNLLESPWCHTHDHIPSSPVTFNHPAPKIKGTGIQNRASTTSDRNDGEWPQSQQSIWEPKAAARKQHPCVNAEFHMSQLSLHKTLIHLQPPQKSHHCLGSQQIGFLRVQNPSDAIRTSCHLLFGWQPRKNQSCIWPSQGQSDQNQHQWRARHEHRWLLCLQHERLCQWQRHISSSWHGHAWCEPPIQKQQHSDKQQAWVTTHFQPSSFSSWLFQWHGAIVFTKPHSFATCHLFLFFLFEDWFVANAGKQLNSSWVSVTQVLGDPSAINSALCEQFSHMPAVSSPQTASVSLGFHACDWTEATKESRTKTLNPMGVGMKPCGACPQSAALVHFGFDSKQSRMNCRLQANCLTSPVIGVGARRSLRMEWDEHPDCCSRLLALWKEEPTHAKDESTEVHPSWLTDLLMHSAASSTTRPTATDACAWAKALRYGSLEGKAP